MFATTQAPPLSPEELEADTDALAYEILRATPRLPGCAPGETRMRREILAILSGGSLTRRGRAAAEFGLRECVRNRAVLPPHGAPESAPLTLEEIIVNALANAKTPETRLQTLADFAADPNGTSGGATNYARIQDSRARGAAAEAGAKELAPGAAGTLAQLLGEPAGPRRDFAESVAVRALPGMKGIPSSGLDLLCRGISGASEPVRLAVLQCVRANAGEAAMTPAVHEEILLAAVNFKGEAQRLAARTLLAIQAAMILVSTPRD